MMTAVIWCCVFNLFGLSHVRYMHLAGHDHLYSPKIHNRSIGSKQIEKNRKENLTR